MRPSIDGCTLSQVGTLDFDFIDGACTNANGIVFLCFSSNSPKSCFYGNETTEIIERTKDSNFDHAYTRIASSGNGGSFFMLRLFSRVHFGLYKE